MARNALRRRYRGLSEDRKRFLADLALSGVMARIEAKHPILRDAHEKAALEDWYTLHPERRR